MANQTEGGSLIARHQVEHLVRHLAFPDKLYGGLKMLPTSQRYGLERCLNEVFADIPFSSDVLVQANCTLAGEIVLQVTAFAKIGRQYRSIILFDSIESCDRLDSDDVVNLICAVVEEVELELNSLRNEGVYIASCTDLQDAWASCEEHSVNIHEEM